MGVGDWGWEVLVLWGAVLGRVVGLWGGREDLREASERGGEVQW